MFKRLVEVFFNTETLEENCDDMGKEIEIKNKDTWIVLANYNKQKKDYGYIRVRRSGLFHKKIIIRNLEELEQVIYMVQDMNFISRESRFELLVCLKKMFFERSGVKFESRHSIMKKK